MNSSLELAVTLPPLSCSDQLGCSDIEHVNNFGPSDSGGLLHSTFNSEHTGGAHFLMADGSVRFISQNVGTVVVDGICRRNDSWVSGEF